MSTLQRIQWLIQEVHSGRNAFVTFSFNENTGKEKITFKLDHHYHDISVYRPCVLGALWAAQAAIQSSVSTDKGHTSKTSGYTVVEFWLQQPGHNKEEAKAETRADTVVVPEKTADGEDLADSNTSETLVEDSLRGLPSSTSPLDTIPEVAEPIEDLEKHITLGVPEAITSDIIKIMDLISEAINANPNLVQSHAESLLEHAAILKGEIAVEFTGTVAHVTPLLTEHCQKVMRSRDALLTKLTEALETLDSIKSKQ